MSVRKTTTKLSLPPRSSCCCGSGETVGRHSTLHKRCCSGGRCTRVIALCGKRGGRGEGTSYLGALDVASGEARSAFFLLVHEAARALCLGNIDELETQSESCAQTPPERRCAGGCTARSGGGRPSGGGRRGARAAAGEHGRLPVALHPAALHRRKSAEVGILIVVVFIFIFIVVVIFVIIIIIVMIAVFIARGIVNIHAASSVRLVATTPLAGALLAIARALVTQARTSIYPLTRRLLGWPRTPSPCKWSCRQC